MTRKKKEEPKRSAWNGDEWRNSLENSFNGRVTSVTAVDNLPKPQRKSPPVARAMQPRPENYTFPVASRRSSEQAPPEVQQ
jgi:hypothetical protein